jgi:hypothetical protein
VGHHKLLHGSSGGEKGESLGKSSPVNEPLHPPMGGNQGKCCLENIGQMSINGMTKKKRKRSILKFKKTSWRQLAFSVFSTQVSAFFAIWTFELN